MKDDDGSKVKAIFDVSHYQSAVEKLEKFVEQYERIIRLQEYLPFIEAVTKAVHDE